MGRQNLFNIYTLINEMRLNPDFVAARFGIKAQVGTAAKRLAAFGSHLLKSILYFGQEWRCYTFARSPVLFFSSTSNQTEALGAIADSFPERAFVVQNQVAAEKYGYPALAAHLLALLLLPLSLAFIAYYIYTGARSYPTRWGIVSHSLDEILLTPGHFLVARIILWKFRPKIVIMSNDHNCSNRALCLAARRYGVISVYVQHAPVSDLFPSLLFDHALVDGAIAQAIYEDKGGATKIVPIGAARYDNFCRAPVGGEDTERENVVSLALNKLDDFNVVLAYAQQLGKLGKQVILRPHPGITDAALQPFDNMEIDRSDIGDHLKKVAYVVAGNSGILLDAFMMGVLPVHARDFSDVTDYYGFEEHGAVLSCELDSLPQVIEGSRQEALQMLTTGMKLFNVAVSCPDERVVDGHVDYIKMLLQRNGIVNDGSAGPQAIYNSEAGTE